MEILCFACLFCSVGIVLAVFIFQQFLHLRERRKLYEMLAQRVGGDTAHFEHQVGDRKGVSRTSAHKRLLDEWRRSDSDPK